MTSTNFLIGRGELLTHDIKGPKRMPGKVEVYTLAQSISRLRPQFARTAESLNALPADACPDGFSVARLLVNPSYIARSFFPAALLRSTGLESVGSRTVKVTPEGWTKKGKPRECTTTELFVAGKRNAFQALSAWTRTLEIGSKEAEDLAHIEAFAPLLAAERIVPGADAKERFYEVGLHLLPDADGSFIQQGFVKFAAALKIKVHTSYAFSAGNLWFVPVEGPAGRIEQLADFAFIRVIRAMPKLRTLRPMENTSTVTVSCDLPAQAPVSGDTRVAILDGGLPDKHAIGPWLRSYRVLDEDVGDDPKGLDHGLAVTSAFLFGPIEPNGTALRPYAFAEHLRVFDIGAHDEDPLELYRTLGFVEEVLLSRQYQFINLSLGPDLPIEDTEVHSWTAVIDDLLRDGKTLMTIAVGNNGARDRSSGNARVMVPSDCVNALAVGAAHDTAPAWKRASYSAVGPGRSPGVVKPDLLAFGGDPSNYFHVLAPGKKPRLSPDQGTSLAAPYLLRSAVGVRAVLGAELSPLAIKALLVHAAERSGHERDDVGWGKLPDDLMSIITCPPGVARVVYQGELKPGKYLRAAVPMPAGGLQGSVRLRATFCYASPTDPQDAAAYTRAGLEVVFRPSDVKIKAGKTNAETKGFFDMKAFATEAERRSDLGKWETVLNAGINLRGTSLSNPVFDIHYNAREAGGRASGPERIPYALIITIEAVKHPDLYNDILRTYAQLLVPIQPQVSLPVRL